jgi:hypothetical protein
MPRPIFKWAVGPTDQSVQYANSYSGDYNNETTSAVFGMNNRIGLQFAAFLQNNSAVS